MPRRRQNSNLHVRRRLPEHGVAVDARGGDRAVQQGLARGREGEGRGGQVPGEAAMLYRWMDEPARDQTGH